MMLESEISLILYTKMFYEERQSYPTKLLKDFLVLILLRKI